MANAFVQVSLRQDGSVRIDAPGFGPANNPGAMGGMMSDMSKESGDASAKLVDGSFAIHTDAEILANNTDEGPEAAADGRVLSWRVNPLTPAAPTALLKLKP